jgi:hypothetical protein
MRVTEAGSAIRKVTHEQPRKVGNIGVAHPREPGDCRNRSSCEWAGVYAGPLFFGGCGGRCNTA